MSILLVTFYFSFYIQSFILLHLLYIKFDITNFMQEIIIIDQSIPGIIASQKRLMIYYNYLLIVSGVSEL